MHFLISSSFGTCFRCHLCCILQVHKTESIKKEISFYTDTIVQYEKENKYWKFKLFLCFYKRFNVLKVIVSFRTWRFGLESQPRQYLNQLSTNSKYWQHLQGVVGGSEYFLAISKSINGIWWPVRSPDLTVLYFIPKKSLLILSFSIDLWPRIACQQQM